MQLEAVIRSANGTTSTVTIDAADYATAYGQIEVPEGGKLLSVRTV